MLEGMSNDYKGAVEDSECQEWLKGDGAAVWYNRTWQRCVVSTPVQCSDSSFVNVFLIDEGKTVSVTNAQLVPLLDRYHEIPPFAICCTVGEYDTYHGKRHDFILECMRIVEYFMGAGMDGLEVEVLDKIYDGKDKLKVRLTHFGRREVCIPDYLIQEQLIFLQ
ncbi:hypothetical protein KIN20_035534 [Parelaphostrongylus tenuis]|uniref:Tudor domain-containing protein n=1 Tax=Parelaphostrongylus tenuis TaxID=148309 RepID=A0AAD5RBX8_PARTN|nr:hypothetical protein KIN20_035534 [Parelaphostrongylus tenuis]